ncbi:VOC family protein [Ramlibacter pallidus]|uniref:Glyoxalase n=1 Tax=Ramlibacter pallidus TaxID=2780087 RepID=A0ABR9S0U0_9BURK|nr:VOC family protein [Ramlibacter pallidus]MBE7367134.1 glyoxalase [Ramlibacter pallidus]
MHELSAIEIKAFVPAKDYALSKRFYADLGFTQRSEGGGVAYFACGPCAFLLQDYYLAEFADNCVMHLLVADVHAWQRHVEQADLAGRYGAKVTPVTEQPWGITEFVVIDPAGVCWHIGQNTPGFRPVGRTG